MNAVGRSIPRKEAFEKVTGAARYNADFIFPGVLHAWVVPSTTAHARLAAVDADAARHMDGVRAVLTGEDTRLLCGEVIEDRPPLARGKVRYYGEPVALVVADTAAEAARAARAVEVRYDPLPVVGSPGEALRPDAPLVHEDLGSYRIAQQPCFPEKGTNVYDRARIRRGEMKRAWADSDTVVEAQVRLPQQDHAAMETRSCRVQILADGRVLVHTTSQAPFEVQKLLSQYFRVAQGKVAVISPLVGGAFGGKASVQLEVLAYLASQATGGRAVRLVNPRERDIAGSPVGTGLEARIRLGARADGRIIAAEMTYLMDAGAYCDSSPRVARAIASECTGPYGVENVSCDVLCVYTNHVYATALRGFGHMPMTFAVERAVEKLAARMHADPAELRRRNAIRPGQSTPTQVKLTANTVGDLPRCVERAQALIRWDEGQRVETGARTVRGKGLACFWKTSSSPQDAISGAILTFNKEGSVNLSVGTVEFGPATKTAAAQILAERLGIGVEQVHVHMDVDTTVDPEHWKSVASMGTYMVGQAVVQAADDAVRQLKSIAAIVLRCPPEDLEIGGGRVHLRDDPEMSLAFKDLAHGYKYPGDKDSIGGQIIGRGSFIMRHLTPLDGATGKGMPGPSWTVGAQAVEVELDTREWTYRIVRAVSVVDAGRVINPKIARGMVTGGVCMGLGYGSRECLMYDAQGRVLTEQLRTYKLMRAGEQPEYLVEFVETPQINAPYGARPIGEHGILAAPAALANALSAAAGVEVDALPATPETIWRAKTGRGTGEPAAGRAVVR